MSRVLTPCVGTAVVVAHASAVPVSRKRKKKSGKPGKSGRSPKRSTVDLRGPQTLARDRELADAWRGFAAFQQQVDEWKASRAASMATDLVTDLVTMVADQPDVIVEDVLCERLGTLLSGAQQAPQDERVRPQHLGEAMVEAAETAVTAALAATTTETDAWRASWRVLTALVCVLPYPFGEVVDETITRLCDTASGRVVPQGPTVAGQLLWTRDRYGSRFAVVAPISTADLPVRWYLWDIDACVHQPFTVHSGFYPTPEAALADWQAGVGQVAAAGTSLTEVDDPRLLADLMPQAEGFLYGNGEGVEQFAEYYRSRRLGEVVMRALPRRRPQPGPGVDAGILAVEFAAWLRARDTSEQKLPEELDELAGELAESWCLNEIDALHATCSPHRVALCVLHMRNFYLDEYAGELLALLPEWTRWLAERNATAAELADRCLPYAHGQPHQQVGEDHSRPNYLARVIE